MPRYDWKCNNCDTIVECVRSMIEHARAPSVPCPSCSHHNYRAMLNAPQVCIEGGGAASSPFPIRVKVGRDHVIFNSKREQDAFNKANGLERYCDGADPAVSDSQHSVFHQGETPPPTARALELSKRTFYCEQDVINQMTA